MIMRLGDNGQNLFLSFNVLSIFNFFCNSSKWQQVVSVNLFLFWTLSGIRFIAAVTNWAAVVCHAHVQSLVDETADGSSWSL